MRLPTMQHNRWHFFLPLKRVECVMLFTAQFLHDLWSVWRLPVQSLRFENNPLELVHIRWVFSVAPASWTVCWTQSDEDFTYERVFTGDGRHHWVHDKASVAPREVLPSGVTWIGGNVEWKPGWMRTGGGQIWSCCAALARLMTEMSTTEMQCDWRRNRVYKEDRMHFDFCAEGKWSLKTCRALIMSLRVGGCPDNSRRLIVVFHYQLWHILFFSIFNSEITLWQDEFVHDADVSAQRVTCIVYLNNWLRKNDTVDFRSSSKNA